MNKRTPSKFTPRNKSDSRPTEYRKRAPAARSNGYDERKVSDSKRPARSFAARNTEYRKGPTTADRRAASAKPASKSQEPKAGSTTSWGPVAEWYDKHLEKSGDTYHDKVVHPNLLRMLGDIKGKHVLDLGCGQGIFSRLLADNGANVIGVDLGKELIDIAEKKNDGYKFNVHYFNSTAHDLFMVKDGTKDVVVCVLAIQNIEKLSETIAEASRVLKKGGKFIMVLNHPAFRNPRYTHWGYDEDEKIQYRRVDQYLSESKIKIDMTPGSHEDKKFTVSFHRPLQVYMKTFGKCGFAMTRLEEWESHRASQKGPKKAAEDKARKEIPLFLAMELTKL